jgi:hypothetical protein
LRRNLEILILGDELHGQLGGWRRHRFVMAATC